MIEHNVLYHHGVKGMRWGIRKAVSNSLQSSGYRIASKYTQKRDISNLKAQKRTGQITSKQYKKKKASIKYEARYDRGRHLVEHNQTFMKTAAKGIGKNAAVDAGAIIVAGLIAGTGAPVTAPLVIGTTAYKIRNTKNTVGTMRDIRTYNKNK